MTSLRRAALLVWGLVTLVVGFVWLSTSVQGVQARFETGARIQHRVLSQRSEQQEAVLVSLSALDRAGVGDTALEEYVRAMRGPYPQIVGVQRCRPRCVNLGAGTAAFPGDALRPDQAGLRWHPGVPPLYALSRDGLRVWVDARRLVRAEDAADATSGFRLSRPGTGAVLAEQAVRRPPSGWDRVLPVLRVQKVLGSAAQPFVFAGVHPLRWMELPMPGVALFALLAAVGTVLSVGMIEGRGRDRAAAREAEQALQAERSRAQSAFHAVSEALIVTDEQDRVSLANPAAHALLGAALVPGQPLREVVQFRATLDQRPFSADGFWGQPGPVELPEGISLVTREGARLVEGALAPVGGGTGRVLVLRDVGPWRARVVAALDEGERRLREHADMLAHVTRLSTLGEMSAGLAHELNQPLTAIVSQGQAALRMLADPDRDEARVQRSVEATVAQAKRAAGIIAHLRGLVKRTPTQTRAVDVNQVLENVAALTAHEAGRAGVRLTVRLSSRPLIVDGDPVHLEQVLLNLVRNAVEATGHQAGGEVRLLAGPHGPDAVVEVRDTGPGLTAAVQDRLFTPFTTTKPGGLGLGLSLSHTLVQGMGGDLRGDNSPGGGAVFTLTLPLAVREPVHA